MIVLIYKFHLVDTVPLQIAICFNRRRRGKLDNKNISFIQNLIFFKRILANENRSTWIPNTFRRIFNNMEKGEKNPAFMYT